MYKFGLIGYPLGHSFSPKIHEVIYKLNNINASYSLIEVNPKKIDRKDYIDSIKGFDGLNVTIPHKTSIINHLDNLSNESQKIGAVNTLNYINNKWHGYNTDIFGFMYPIMNLIGCIDSCLVIGTGGAARAVLYAINKFLNPKTIILIGRNTKKANILKNTVLGPIKNKNIVIDIIQNIDKYTNDVDLIINTTSVGMHPNISESILPDAFTLKNDAIVYDLIYNPIKTCFLEKAKKMNPKCKTINGVQMLIAQAVKSVEIWTGKEISIENVINTLNKSNILL